ncbi:unnamed protein product [Ilex paraguariensis]|uniref:Uncharacterized protein n=1 Tax=Ilex paraguariensis TaxID=185542 RepID=A0ABC8RCP0_9AQUA
MTNGARSSLSLNRNSLHIFSKIASARGIASNMSPPTWLKFSVPWKLPTTCARSSTMHFKCGNASAMALATVPMPPPMSTREFNPSNTPFQSLTTTLVTNRASLDMASLKK